MKGAPNGTPDGAEERPNSLGRARSELDGALGVMRDNMTMMVEREGQLEHLRDKSHSLQGTSGAFARQAKQLKWQTQWRQSRMAILAVVLAIWGALMYVFRHHFKVYLAVSSGLLTVLYFVQRYLTKRWLAQLEEAEDQFQLLHEGKP
eukprot:gnl/TRDRNA2_/TRDRNA2_193293_c0_seq1.p1 gnl/TRDRNA2_/TRDRNA2_193293_c0~~gnl/TRDRNA2_/TRDRNA2_193293_c0_seq1.p1  ORF type:complete len:148 (-),score=25.24 gnl/TRDRNA2_/TRDRNA2_193293_c0_seq1:36-479(-)